MTTNHGAPGHNGMTRDEWIHAILRSGEVTRISQHLALVIYHLSDPATNMAQLSARDLEAITGWGRTTIREHVDEIDMFIRVRWGQGRAKAIFELQGVITEAVRPLRMAREGHVGGNISGHMNIGHVATNSFGEPTGHKFLASQAATNDGVVSQPATNQALNGVVASQVATKQTEQTVVAGHAVTTVCGEPSGHKAVMNNVLVASQVATKSNLGGGKGGDTFESEFNHHHHGSPAARARGGVDATPVSFIVHPDGSFTGTAFEHFTATEIASMRAVYSCIDLLAELANADRYLAREFERDGTPFGTAARADRLHMMLRKRNDDAHARIRAIREAASEKAKLNPDADCWFDGDGRLMVANGFESDMLAIKGIDGDKHRLRTVLDKAALVISLDLRGAHLKKNVRASVTKNVGWDEKDERKTLAIERGRVQQGSVTADGKIETLSERLLRRGAEIEQEVRKP